MYLHIHERTLIHDRMNMHYKIMYLHIHDRTHIHDIYEYALLNYAFTYSKT